MPRRSTLPITFQHAAEPFQLLGLEQEELSTDRVWEPSSLPLKYFASMDGIQGGKSCQRLSSFSQNCLCSESVGNCTMELELCGTVYLLGSDARWLLVPMLWYIITVLPRTISHFFLFFQRIVGRRKSSGCEKHGGHVREWHGRSGFPLGK